MSYRVRLFGTLVVPSYIQNGDSQNMGTGAALTSFLALPGGGFWDNYQDLRSPQGIRPITKSGIFFGTDAEIRAELQAWRALLGKRDRLTVEWDDGTLMWQWARLQDVDAPRPSNAKGGWLPFTLTWITAAQNWRGVVYGAEGWTWGDGSWVFGDGTAEMGEGSQSFDLTTADQTVTVTHDGSIDAANVTLRFDMVGDWQDVTIINTTTGQQIVVNRAATADERFLEINAGARTIWLGDELTSITSMARSQNTLSVTATVADLADNMSIRIADTDEYDGDYYPVTTAGSGAFSVPLSTLHPGYGTVTTGTARYLSSLYSVTTFSDKARWLVLAPGENNINVVWSTLPTEVTMTVEFTEHYA